MGLLDDFLAQGANPTQPSGQTIDPKALIGLLNQALQSQGGLAGLARLFQQGGLGDVVSSWIGKGENLPISPQQLQQILGGTGLSQIASQLGLSSEDPGSHLAGILPGLIDQATPDGTRPESEPDPIGGLLGQFLK